MPTKTKDNSGKIRKCFLLNLITAHPRNLAVTNMGADWEQHAKAKRDSVNALIPESWRISNPPARESQPDIAGSFLHQFLSAQEIEITETDAVGIAKKTCAGAWTAVDVVKAFSHRAALAHQLVRWLLLF